jgi:hypothetical protein
MSPVKYEQDFYILEDAILHSHRRENFKSYTVIGLVLTVTLMLKAISCAVRILGYQITTIAEDQPHGLAYGNRLELVAVNMRHICADG